MGRRLHASLALGAAAALVAACTSLDDLVDRGSLDGTRWQAVVVAGLAPVPGSEPTLVFAGGTVSGFSGCNGYETGKVTVALPSFKVEGLSVGRARCDNDNQLAIESSFLRALSGANIIEVSDGGRLVLTGPGGQLVFQQVGS